MKIILHVPIEQAQKAAEVAQTFNSWYNTPDWDKKKLQLGKNFDVHETEAKTIVVNAKK